MRRIRVALAILAAAAFVVIVTGCGGGGGGGGGTTPPITETTTLTGRVVDSTGSPVQGATVTVDTGSTKAILTGTSDFNGLYSIGNVPVGIGLNITAAKSGVGTVTLTGVTLGSTSAKMDIVTGGEAAPVGSTVSISPALTELYEGQTKTFGIEVRNSAGTQIFPTSLPGWKTSLVVTGAATGQFNVDDTTSFSVTGGHANQAATVTVTIVRTDGSTAKATSTVTIRSMDVPPPPPL